MCSDRFVYVYVVVHILSWSLMLVRAQRIFGTRVENAQQRLQSSKRVNLQVSTTDSSAGNIKVVQIGKKFPLKRVYSSIPGSTRQLAVYLMGGGSDGRIVFPFQRK